MRPLTKNTFFDIARQTNKTLKLVELMARAEYKLFYSHLGMIHNGTDPIEVIERFHKDLTSTIGILEKAYLLLSTVDKDGDVVHLKGEEKNLKKLFGEYYDHDNKKLSLSTTPLLLNKAFDADFYKACLLQNTLGLSRSEYENLFKNRKKLFSLQKDQLYTDDDKVKYLSIVKDATKNMEVLDKIYDMANEFSEYRSKLPLEIKNKIDREITFERSMIDSVLSTSTYITKDGGIENIASPHKKEKDLVKIINSLIEKHPYINAIEIDKDVSLNAVLDMLSESRMNDFNMSTGVTVKIRKLGNYNVRGMYIPSENIVAFTVVDPNAAVHEFVHAVELSSPDILYSPQRRAMYLEMNERLDKELLSEMYGDKFASYICNDKEIIARSGEIAYLLNKHDYKTNEDFDDFANRVREFEKKNSKDENTYEYVKPIDYYINSPEIYFDIKNADLSTLSNMKGFFQSYFSHDGRKIKPIETASISAKTYKNIKNDDETIKKSRYQLTSVSTFTPNNIEFGLEYNDKEKIVDPAILIKEIIEKSTHIGRNKFGYNYSILTNQAEVCNKIAQYIRDKNDPYLNAEVLKNMHKVLFKFGDNPSDYNQTILLKNVFEKNIKISNEHLFNEYNNKLEKVENISNLIEDININSIDEKQINLPIAEQIELNNSLRQLIPDSLYLIKETFIEDINILKQQLSKILGNEYSFFKEPISIQKEKNVIELINPEFYNLFDDKGYSNRELKSIISSTLSEDQRRLMQSIVSENNLTSYSDKLNGFLDLFVLNHTIKRELADAPDKLKRKLHNNARNIIDEKISELSDRYSEEKSFRYCTTKGQTSSVPIYRTDEHIFDRLERVDNKTEMNRMMNLSKKVLIDNNFITNEQILSDNKSILKGLIKLTIKLKDNPSIIKSSSFSNNDEKDEFLKIVKGVLSRNNYITLQTNGNIKKGCDINYARLKASPHGVERALTEKQVRYMTSSIGASDHGLILSGFNTLVKEIMNSENLKETLSFLKKEDHLSHALLTDPAIINTIDNKEKQKDFIKLATEILLANGHIDKLFENKDSHIISYKFNYKDNSLENKSTTLQEALPHLNIDDISCANKTNLFADFDDLSDLIKNSIKTTADIKQSFNTFKMPNTITNVSLEGTEINKVPDDPILSNLDSFVEKTTKNKSEKIDPNPEANQKNKNNKKNNDSQPSLF
jgi:hypothetical protein